MNPFAPSISLPSFTFAACEATFAFAATASAAATRSAAASALAHARSRSASSTTDGCGGGANSCDGGDGGRGEGGDGGASDADGGCGGIDDAADIPTNATELMCRLNNRIPVASTTNAMANETITAKQNVMAHARLSGDRGALAGRCNGSRVPPFVVVAASSSPGIGRYLPFDWLRFGFFFDREGASTVRDMSSVGVHQEPC